MSWTVQISHCKANKLKDLRLKCDEAMAAARLPTDENTVEIIALLFVSLIPADLHGSASKKRAATRS